MTSNSCLILETFLNRSMNKTFGQLKILHTCPVFSWDNGCTRYLFSFRGDNGPIHRDTLESHRLFLSATTWHLIHREDSKV